MEITYDYYRIFYYVAKYKSFSRAAEVLMSNQPNITKFINNLENQIGCRLFVRSNRGVSLTPEGEKLYTHVAIAYSHLHMAELELASDQSLQSGIVTIGTSETGLYGILLDVLKDFHRTYPGIRLHILSYSTPQAIQILKKGLIDFAVITTPALIKKPLKETILTSFQEIMIGSPQYNFLSRDARHLSELTAYPLICLVKDTSTYAFYNQLYLEHNLIFEPEAEVATVSQILPMILNDLGIGFIPESFAAEPLKRKEIIRIPLLDTIPKRNICLVEDTSRPLSIAANALATMIRDYSANHSLYRGQQTS